MNYRIYLLTSGLLFMFSVYGFIMMIGAIVGEAEAATGNFIMGMIFAVLTAVMLRVGMVGRKKAHKKFNAIIEEQLNTSGYVDAQLFATTANISLDDARDVLTKIAATQHWSCTEMGGYNAHYSPR